MAQPWIVTKDFAQMEQDRLSRIENNARLRPYIRSIIAQARGGSNALSVAKSLYPNDRATHSLLTRGAVTPTSTTTSSVPTSTALADLLPLLGPSSASGGLFARALKLNLGEASAVMIPEITVSGTNVSFIAQGAAFPIKQLAFDANKILGLKKLAFGVVLTRELYEHSNAEQLIARVLAENLTLGIDSILFDATAVDTTRPAGLLYDVDKIDATSGGGIDAMATDLTNLAAAIAPVAGMQIAFIASPKLAVKIQLRRTMNISFPVLSSAALAGAQPTDSGIVMAVATNALVVSGDEAPRFEISKAAPVVLQDPGVAFSTAGSPNTVGAVAVSPFQQDQVVLRFIQDLNWILRGSGAVAFTDTVSW
jgi:hypothetical protein